MIRRFVAVSAAFLALALVSLGGEPRLSAQVQSPDVPAPVAVTLDPSTTAFLALDFQSTNCSEASRPACVAQLPILSGSLSAARAANVPVFYSYTPGGSIRPEVAPSGTDVQLETSARTSSTRPISTTC